MYARESEDKLKKSDKFWKYYLGIASTNTNQCFFALISMIGKRRNENIIYATFLYISSNYS